MVAKFLIIREQKELAATEEAKLEDEQIDVKFQEKITNE